MATTRQEISARFAAANLVM